MRRLYRLLLVPLVVGCKASGKLHTTGSVLKIDAGLSLNNHLLQP